MNERESVEEIKEISEQKCIESSRILWSSGKVNMLITLTCFKVYLLDVQN